MDKRCYRCGVILVNQEQSMRQIVDIDNIIKYRCYNRCDTRMMKIKRETLENNLKQKRLKREREVERQKNIQRTEKGQRQILEEETKRQEQQIENSKILKIKICKCCFSEVENVNNLFGCSNITSKNKHKVCYDCLSMYFEHNFNNGLCSLDCMFDKTDDCHGVYTMDHMNHCLDRKKADKYTNNYEMNEIKKISNLINNYQICPSCKKYGVEVHPSTLKMATKIWIRCEKCKQRWCSFCIREETNHRKKCYAVDYDNTMNSDEYVVNKIEEVEKIIVNIIDDIVVHKCPYCNTSYIKEEGCNLITCSSCNGRSCFLCREKITERKNNSYYWHFKDHVFNDGDSTCPLFNYNQNEIGANLKYVKNRIQESIHDFILSNDIEINTLVYYILKFNNKYSNNMSLKEIIDDIRIPRKYKSNIFITRHKNKHRLSYDYLKKYNKLKKLWFPFYIIHIMFL